MSAQRKRLFGPITYSAMLAGALACLYSGVEIAGPRVEEWIEQRRILSALRSPNINIRLQTVASLAKQGPLSASAYLLEAVNDPNFDVSIAACGLLADWGASPQPLIPVLSAAANDQKQEIRVETARILGRILAHAASGIRSSADIPKSAATQSISQGLTIVYRLLKDPAEDVRAAAAASLGESRLDAAVAGELIAAASDKDRGVRLQIARSLLRINGPADPTAARLLIPLVADPEPIGDRSQAFEVLKQASEETRNQGMAAMAALLSRDEPEIQPDVLNCLGEAGPQAQVVLPILEKLLNDPDFGTRAAAVNAILMIHPTDDPRLTKVMLDMIADKSLPQEYRTEMLAKISEKVPNTLAKLTPSLIRQLGDKDARIRRSALDLLSQIIEEHPAEMPDQSNAR